MADRIDNGTQFARKESSMDSQALSEWLDSLPLSEKISALSLIYSSLTVSTRELFLPNRTAGKEEFVLRALQGLNEMHHALASQLLSYSVDGDNGNPANWLFNRLLDTVGRYGLGDFLTSAVRFARTRNLPTRR